MTSHLHADFRRCFRKLPTEVRRIAKKNYLLWRDNPSHPSLQFKCVNRTLSAYSIRIGTDWRAIGLVADGEIIWFWIGPHTEYDHILNRL